MYLQDIQEKQDPGCDALLSTTDLLIDGPYIRELPDETRPWVGSANQRFHFLTDRYAHLAEQLGAIPNRLEIHVSVNGVVRVNGMAPAVILEAFGGARRTGAL
jgi:anaerobic ribonucleoside-triphosphate reductase activating protein